MKLADIGSWVMDKLTEEAGTNKWWTLAQVKTHVNEVYQDTALTLECVGKRDETTTTVVGTARYVIPIVTGIETILRLKKVAYDEAFNGALDFYTEGQLDDVDMRWRGLSNATPWGAYFAKGDENIAVTLVPPPSDAKILAFEFRFLPSELGDNDEPVPPFKDGFILKDGAMSMALALPGGGRDLDRADYYFNKFMSNFGNLTKHVSPITRGLRSIEESVTRTGGVRLPSNYPRYSFD
jgi:hypothetical protein